MVVRELITKLGFKTDQAALERYDQGLQKAEGATRMLSLGILAAGVASFKFASDLDESLNKSSVTFGKLSDDVVAWSKTTRKAIGLSQGTALEMVTLFGDMGKGMELNIQTAAEYSKQLVGRAADLASFKNVSVEVAKNALKGIYTGETESLKNLGVVMTQANLKRFAMSKGITKNIKDMTQAEQVQLRYNFVMNATRDAAGDFAETSEGAANQTRILLEGLKELATVIGRKLIPIGVKLLNIVNGIVDWFATLDESTIDMIIQFAALLAAIFPLIKIMRLIIFLQTALNTAMMLNPIGLVVVAIIALGAAFIYLYNKSETFREGVQFLWSVLKQVFEWIWEYIKSTIEFYKKLWDYVVMAFNGIAGAIQIGVDALGRFWEKAKGVASSVGQHFMNMLNTLISISKKVFDVITWPYRKAWELLTKFFSWLDAKLGIIDKIKSVAGAVGNFFGGGDEEQQQASTRTPALAYAGASPGGSTENINVSSSVQVQVPQGTPAAQQRFLQEQARTVVREEMQTAMRSARQTNRRAE